MAVKPFALILCLHATVHHVANNNDHIGKRDSVTRNGVR
jgi:hypothetical protein